MAQEITEFSYPLIKKVLSGEGSLGKIPQILKEEGGCRRLLVVSSNSVWRSHFYSELLDSLDISIEEFHEVTQHSPVEEIEHGGVEMLRNRNCDCILSIGGGGSVQDSSKLMRKFYETGIKHVAVPTTLSAAEFSPSAGYSLGGEKMGMRDPEMVPGYVILDPPRATLETPDWLWLSTGIRALDHAVETLVDSGNTEISETFALMAIEKLFTNLGSRDTRARLQCQIASWYSYFQASDISLGTGHRIGRAIGGAKWDIPHGMTSCITLPVMARYYSLRHTAQMAKVARAIGFRGGSDEEMLASKAAEAISILIEKFGLRHRLSDFGISHDDLGEIAGKVGGSDTLKLLEEML